MNNIEKDIKKIIDYYNIASPISVQKKEDEIDILVNEIIQRYYDGNYDFSKFATFILNTNGKKREIREYAEWSIEKVLCTYLKNSLDKVFKIKYPNRNNQITLLFDNILTIQTMNDFTIMKFDFKDFFNSISTEYVFLKYIIHSNLDREQKNLFKEFVQSCNYCYTGINISNVMAEIIANEFDKVLMNTFKNNGLIFYKRYVDDGILIFNRHIEESYCIKKLKNCIDTVFKDTNINVSNKCNTCLNLSSGKYSYISKRVLTNATNIKSFSYLGYKFILELDNNKNINIKYGITDEKIKKYSIKIKKIILDYKDNQDVELLRHRLKAFSHRIVYRRKRYSSKIWIVKGFTSNYNELRYHLNNLDFNTREFLENIINQSFDALNLKQPYFLKVNEKHKKESIYSLFNNLEKNRTLLFEENENIGINKKTLKKMCKQIGINNLDKSYDSLLREYLIKIKVGH